ncbi:hypothetical protein MIR68_005072 [Amoeboaphelidium protococcarum]|nr:hypothetical protein MIR68_005072 [Amoeboaphelidium protococcarum]
MTMNSIVRVYDKFDDHLVVPIDNVHEGQSAFFQEILKSVSVDCNDPLISSIEHLLRLALGDRVEFLVCWWQQSIKHTDNKDIRVLNIGFTRQYAQSKRTVDYGPMPEDVKAVKQFKNLWGPLAELRKFKSGSIWYSVVWDLDTVTNAGDDIVHHIIQTVLGQHVSRTCQALTFDNKLQTLINAPRQLQRVHPLFSEIIDATFDKAVAAGIEFSKVLKSLPDLPLYMNDIKVVSPFSRQCSVFVPHGVSYDEWNHVKTNFEKPAVPIMDLIIELESSSKWPQDLVALQNMKQLYLLSIHKQLIELKLKSWFVKCQRSTSIEGDISEKLVVISESTHVFAIYLYVKQEKLMRLRQQFNPDLSQSEQQIAKSEYLKNIELYEVLPIHHQVMTAAVHKYPVLSDCIRLVKRWLSCHLLLTDMKTWKYASGVREEVVELLCVYVFRSSARPKQNLFAAFLQVLQLFAEYNFAEYPVFINFGKDSNDQMAAVQKHFNEVRRDGQKKCGIYVSVLNAIEDSNELVDFSQALIMLQQSYLTQRSCDADTAQRLRVLAKSAIAHVDRLYIQQQYDTKALMSTFMPQTCDYDIAIRLDCHQTGAVARQMSSAVKGLKAEDYFKNMQLPMKNQMKIGYDPVTMLIESIFNVIPPATCIDQFRVDLISSSFIGIVLKKNVLQWHQWQESIDYTVELDEDSGLVKLDIASVVASIERLGGSLIKSINIK